MTIVQKIGVKYIRTKFALLSKLSKRKAAEQALALFTTPQSRVPHKLTPVFAGAEKLQLKFGDGTVQGYRWNHPAKKKVLILHGYESSIVYFGPYVNPLIKKGYEVLGFDAPAHGASTGKQINAIDYKNLVLEIINQFGPVTSFITHSFGGLAVSMALEELPHNETWKVVFIAPATESTRAIDNFFSYVKLDADVRKEFDMLITQVNNQPPSWYSVSRIANDIKAQVLFLQDKNDNLTPLSDVEPIMAKGYPNFTFIITEGLGHSKIYRDEGTRNSVIRFL